MSAFTVAALKVILVLVVMSVGESRQTDLKRVMAMKGAEQFFVKQTTFQEEGQTAALMGWVDGRGPIENCAVLLGTLTDVRQPKDAGISNICSSCFVLVRIKTLLVPYHIVSRISQPVTPIDSQINTHHTRL